jgi:hypothetical protein
MILLPTFHDSGHITFGGRPNVVPELRRVGAVKWSSPRSLSIAAPHALAGRYEIARPKGTCACSVQRRIQSHSLLTGNRITRGRKSPSESGVPISARYSVTIAIDCPTSLTPPDYQISRPSYHQRQRMVDRGDAARFVGPTSLKRSQTEGPITEERKQRSRCEMGRLCRDGKLLPLEYSWRLTDSKQSFAY